MKTLQIEVDIDEANLILEGLGALPYAKVYRLIAKIQQQATRQIEGEAAGHPDAPPPASTVNK